MENTNPNFIPYPGYIVLRVPKEIYPKIHMTNVNVWKQFIDDKAKELVNGELEIASIGEGVTFVKEGDKICLAAHSRIQTIEGEAIGNVLVSGDSFVNSDYPRIWWIIRESDILVKFK